MLKINQTFQTRIQDKGARFLSTPSTYSPTLLSFDFWDLLAHTFQ